MMNTIANPLKLNKFKNGFLKGALALALMAGPVVGGADLAQAQTRKSVFQTGEELTYKVKFGFIKLGTVSIKTGGPAANYGANKLTAKMQFATADVPFLDAKSLVTDVIDTSAMYLVHFDQKGQEGDKKQEKTMTYDKAKKTLTYNDAQNKNKVTNNVEPFNDALTLVFNMRTWSASGKRYSFPMRSKDGENNVVVNFTNKISNQEVEAWDGKEIRTRVLQGQANMGEGAPLGANGKFTAYVTDDAAAIPVKIDMNIAIGSITLELVKVKRAGWNVDMATAK
jgi:hypothetical protein